MTVTPRHHGHLFARKWTSVRTFVMSEYVYAMHRDVYLPFSYDFHSNAWYYEFVLMLRRVLVIVLCQVSPLKRLDNLYLTLFVCQVCLVLQLVMKPYKNPRLNMYECLMLFLLNTALLIMIAHVSDRVSNDSASFMLFVVMCVPLCCVVYELLRRRVLCKFATGVVTASVSGTCAYVYALYQGEWM